MNNSKKKQKKIRSRNNQEFAKLKMIENNFININNNIKLNEEISNSKINKNKNDENIINKIQNSKKEIKKKIPLISPKLKSKENNNVNIKKKINIANQNFKIRNNNNNNFINKDKNEKVNLSGINKTKNSSHTNLNKNENNKNLMYNFFGKVKLNV